MKCLVLKRNVSAYNDPFMEVAGDDAPALEATVEDLGHRDAADRRRDPDVDDVIPSIPFSLIEPVAAGAGANAAAPGWGLEAVGATTASGDGSGVTVAVLDTGIDTAHPAFFGLKFDATNLMDFTTDDRGVPGAAPDAHGHGTHVAGTIFGRDVGGTRIGVARGVTKVLIGKVLGPQGGPTEAVFNAMQWALNQRADVISMSLGIDFPKVVERFVAEGFPSGIAAARALEAYRANVRLFDRLSGLIAALAARGRGAVVVAATGNESRRAADPRFTVPVAPPAAADGFISVGALGRTAVVATPFAVAPFSNTGCVLSAPGVDVLSARLVSKGGGLVGDERNEHGNAARGRCRGTVGAMAVPEHVPTSRLGPGRAAAAREQRGRGRGPVPIRCRPRDRAGAGVRLRDAGHEPTSHGPGRDRLGLAIVGTGGGRSDESTGATHQSDTFAPPYAGQWYHAITAPRQPANITFGSNPPETGRGCPAANLRRTTGAASRR